jgi:hypothetical protein
LPLAVETLSFCWQLFNYLHGLSKGFQQTP